LTLLAVGNPMTRAEPSAAEREFDMQELAYLKPLAHTGAEIQRVTSMFGRHGRRLEGIHATENELEKADLSTVQVLHFATHGLIDEDSPGRSGLALTATPPDHDGILQTREVFKLRLKAALVTLSACRTALGKEVSGEGLVGLARAFFYAGANAVMASLWNVNDASAVRWMEDFYRELRAGRPIDDAARSAKLGFLRENGALRHPYYWAPFIVTGDASVAFAPEAGSTRAWTAAAGMLVALLSTASVIVRRKGRRTAAAMS
jgi:CHAT domain-containing protein